MTYGLYIGICAVPLKTATTKEELRTHLDSLDPLDRAQGWTIAPIEERSPWPSLDREKSPIALTVGLTLLVLCLWIVTNLFAHCL